MLVAPLLAQAGEQDPLKLLFQLIVLAFLFAGPLLARVLKKMASGDKGAAESPSKGVRGARPQRAEPRNEAERRSEAEDMGGDLWRQLMELEEVPELEEIAPPPVPRRRPADPMRDPDVELAQDTALERRRAAARRPKQVTPPIIPVGRLTTTGTHAADGPLTKRVRIEAFESALSELPTEEQLERQPLGSRPSLSPIPGGGFSSSALPSMGGVSEAARELTSIRGTGTEIGSLAPADLRRAMLLSEVLGPPVSERRNGWGDRDSLGT